MMLDTLAPAATITSCSPFLFSPRAATQGPLFRMSVPLRPPT